MWGSGSFPCVYMLWINRAINCYRKEKKSVKIKAEAQAAVSWVWEENGVQAEIWERGKIYIYIHTYIYYRGGWKWNRISWEILRRVRLKKSALTKRKARPRVSNARVYFGDVICNTLQFFHMWFCLCQFLSSQLSSLLHPFIISCIFPSFPNFSSSCPLPFGPSPWTPFINAYSEMLH